MDAGPSRAAFLDEVLVAEPSLSTSLFDDYTRGSYHVRKDDVVQGLRERAAECGVRLRAIVVFGPVGPLWAYFVAALMDEDGAVRVNALVMAHARITSKGTGRISIEAAEELLGDLKKSASLGLRRPGGPSDGELSYNLLLALFGQQEPQFFQTGYDEMSPDPTHEELRQSVNAILERAATTTYPAE